MAPEPSAYSKKDFIDEFLNARQDLIDDIANNIKRGGADDRGLKARSASVSGGGSSTAGAGGGKAGRRKK